MCFHHYNCRISALRDRHAVRVPYLPVRLPQSCKHFITPNALPINIRHPVAQALLYALPFRPRPRPHLSTPFSPSSSIPSRSPVPPLCRSLVSCPPVDFLLVLRVVTLSTQSLFFLRNRQVMLILLRPTLSILLLS